MPEGIIGGIFGEGDEKPEAEEAPESLVSANAFAAAVAARLAGNDPGVARKTEQFLSDQSELLKTQVAHLNGEHAARLHYLQGQAREVDIRRLGLRLRVGFQLFISFIAFLVVLGLFMIFRDAVTSRSVVIDAFDIAPNVASEVPSGKIVATSLLDVLTQIQAASRSNIERRSLSNAWTSEIEIEVPETGIAVGQIERLIKTRFGHDQHIEGDVVKVPSGVALTVRGSGILAKTFSGQAGDLDTLLRQAGEYVFGQSQPGLWSAYLTNNSRNAEMIDFAQGAYTSANATERPYVLNYWANAIMGLGGPKAAAEALPIYREAVRQKPDFWIGYNNILNALYGDGEEEEAVQVGKQMMRAAGGRPGRADEDLYGNYDQLVWDLPALRAEYIVDVEANNGIGTGSTGSGAENLIVAQTEAQLHDLQAATLRLKTTVVNQKQLVDVAAAAMARALIAEETEDLKTAVVEWDAFAAAYADPAVATFNPSQLCFAAVTYEKTAQPAKANAALQPYGGFNFVDCYRFKADVLDLRGDWEAAQHWYNEAVKLAPSIPSSYYSWGLALARHGDAVGAAEKFKQANERGPHWADPLKAWGDVLEKQGDRKGALIKYDEAFQYAPNWQRLKELVHP